MNWRVILEVWTTCHVNCTFCYKEYDKNIKNYFKSLKDIKEEIKLISKKTNKVLLTWWETMIYPYICELLEECHKYNIKVCIVTVWDKISDMDFLKKIINTWSVDSFQLSIHTLEKDEWIIIYWKEWIVEKQIKWIKNLLELNSIKFWINIVMNKYNINSIWKTILSINDMWVKIFYISAIHIFDWVTKNNILSAVLYIKIKEQLEIIKDRLDNWKLLLALKSFPLCVHKLFDKFKYEIRELNILDSLKANNNWETDWEVKKRFKSKIHNCEWCFAYEKKCFWPYTFYVKMFWAKEFKALNNDDYNFLCEKNKNNVWKT
jgi:MoaA/NifB/PqqE/SkfB family radical SAM enzyme